ncbi:GerMN domain-containing protein [Pseudosporangium ferrugineum]|uniref:Sporulation and spore germination protein n=1 Tax=Pseudosporangium ferrugineum TaxID=439699 RepID=A0A2T0RG99_9ACTN|nr:GerMN domain-containing protein [Pseudosporangium ferrugineum]PRY20130.1 sporulation and spore germination protein [Pseudosporangium ferrugineum]
MTYRTWMAFIGLLTVLVLGSCGLPAEDQPHRVELPRRALTSPASQGPTTEPPGEVVEVLCLVRDGRLVQTVRRVGAAPTPQRQAEHLAAGPTEVERATGLTTALATTSLTVDVPAGGTEARVDVAETDESNARSDETIAYGQIVCTLTSRADVSSVVFTRAGEVLQVPRADGSLSRGPLRADDYASLIAPS